MKKLLSILLASVMLLGLAAPVFAEDNEQPAADPAPVTDPYEDPADGTDPYEDPAEDPSEDPVDPSDPADDPSDPVDDPSDPTEDPVDPADPKGEIGLEEIGNEKSGSGETTYAIWNADDRILTLYYGVPTEDAVSEGFGYSEPTSYLTPLSAGKTAVKVVVDASFANARPTCLKYLFLNFGSLTEITGLSNIKTGTVTNFIGMFLFCRKLRSLDLNSWDMSHAENIESMFGSCSSLTTLNVGSWNTASLTNLNAVFKECSSLTTLDVGNWDTSSVTSMYSLFDGCTNLTSLDVSNWKVGSVTDMSRAFCWCKSLPSIDVSRWDTHSAISMPSMFESCESITSINVRSFNTSSVTSMWGMFRDCPGLTSIDVSSFDTSSVVLIREMFSMCSGLTSLDVSNFDTRAASDMNGMFSACSGLTMLDLSSFDTHAVDNIERMFAYSTNLHTIYVDGSKWDVDRYMSSSMVFKNCSSLVGGKGTVVGSDVGKTHAHIDTVENPGYLTDINDKPILNLGTSGTKKQFHVDSVTLYSDSLVYAKLPQNNYPFSATDYPTLIGEGYAGKYVFAGYCSGVGAEAETNRNGGYARFLPIGVLDMYLQFRHTSRAKVDPQNKTDLRFLTSIPDPETIGSGGILVGFKLLNVTDGFRISDHAFGIEYCYDEITGNYKVSDGSGGQVSLTPDRFYAGISARVALQTIIGMPNSYFTAQKILSVQPYIITKDGTYSYAAVHTFRLKYASDGSKMAVPVA